MDGAKMAKSAGNFERVTDLAERGLEPLALRYLSFTVRYGRKLNYSHDSLAAAAAALASLRSRLAALGPAPATGPWAAPRRRCGAGASGPRPTGIAQGVAGHQEDPEVGAASLAFPLTDRAGAPAAPLSPAGRALHDRFVAALDDDLDLPTALAVVRETLRADLPDDERRWLVLDADLVLGLDLHLASAASPATAEGPPAGLGEREQALLAERDAARAARDWARADALRDELAAAGIELVDGPAGTTWRRV